MTRVGRWSQPANARWVLGACLVAVLGTAAVVGWNRGRSLRRCLLSLVHSNESSIGDPLPSVVAAQRLAAEWQAPIYEGFAAEGSSFVYPPIAALPYAPLAGADLRETRQRLVWCSRTAWLACVAFALLLVRSCGAGTRAGFLVWGAFVFHPLLQAVHLNQASLLVATCFGAGTLLARHRRIVAAGAACALAAAFKPQLAVVPLLVAMCSRRFGWSALLTLALVGLLSLAYAGFDNHWRYLTVVLPQLADGYAFHPNQAWNGFFLRLAGASPHEFTLAEPVPWLRAVGITMSIAMLGVGAAVLRGFARRTKDDDQLPLAMLFAWQIVTLASPISWEHHYIPALFVFAWLLREACAGRASRATVVLAALAAPAIAGYIDVRSWSQHPVAVFAMSYVLWGGLLLAAAVACHLLRRPPAPAN